MPLTTGLFRAGCRAGLLFFACAALAPAQKSPVAVDGIRAGVSTRGEVELAWGEPRSQADAQAFEYAPPAGLPGVARLEISYFEDTTQVSRMDVYLTVPVSADTARAEAALGTRTLIRDRERGAREELYAPSLRGLIFTSRGADAPVVALSYLSSRYFADIYAARFREAMRNQRYSDARVDADKAVALDSEYARGYLLQGDYFAAQSNSEEALVRYAAAAAAKYPPLYVAEGHLELITRYGLDKKWVEKAQAEFQQALAGAATAAQRSEAHARLAQVLADQKRGAEVLQELTAAVDADRANPRPHLGLADHYYGKHEYAQARPHYLMAARLLDQGPLPDPTVEGRRQDVYFRCAFTLGEAHEREQAEHYYRAVLQLDPQHAATLNNLGNLARDSGRLAEALDLYRRGVAAHPTDRLMLNNYGHALVLDGQYEEARVQAQRALAQKADDGMSLAVMARAWAAQGKKKEALASLRRAAAAGYHHRDLASEPAFHKISHDDEFRKLVEQMK